MEANEEARAAAVCAISCHLVDQLPKDVPHSVLIEALLLAFAAVVDTHPCCRSAAGHAALKIGGHLLERAESQPTTTH